MGEQPGGGGEHAGAEVADGELAQLTDEQGESERRQVEAEERDPVALQDGAHGVQPADDGARRGGRAQGDHVAVLLDERVQSR